MRIIYVSFYFYIFIALTQGNLPLLPYIVTEKINPQEFPRNPAISSNIKGTKSLMQCSLFLRHSNRHSACDQCELAQLLCSAALQTKNLR